MTKYWKFSSKRSETTGMSACTIFVQFVSLVLAIEPVG